MGSLSHWNPYNNLLSEHPAGLNVCSKCGQYLPKEPILPRSVPWEYPLSKAEKIDRLQYVLNAEAERRNDEVDAANAENAILKSLLTISQSKAQAAMQPKHVTPNVDSKGTKTAIHDTTSQRSPRPSRPSRSSFGAKRRSRRFSLREALPTTAQLDCSTDIPATFSQLRSWFRNVKRKGEFLDAWDRLDPEHQRAVHGFLSRESQKICPRRLLAKELLSLLPPINQVDTALCGEADTTMQCKKAAMQPKQVTLSADKDCTINSINDTVPEKLEVQIDSAPCGEADTMVHPKQTAMQPKQVTSSADKDCTTNSINDTVPEKLEVQIDTARPGEADTMVHPKQTAMQPKQRTPSVDSASSRNAMPENFWQCIADGISDKKIKVPCASVFPAVHATDAVVASSRCSVGARSSSPRTIITNAKAQTPSTASGAEKRLSLQQELPTIAELDCPTDIPEAFCKLRSWIRSARRKGEFLDVWYQLDPAHKRAIHGFLSRESQKVCPRRHQAKELLSFLPSVEQVDAPPRSDVHTVENLPHLKLLDHPDDTPHVFGMVRKWMKQAEREGSFQHCWRRLGSEYQRAVHDFLIRESRTYSVRRRQAEELLKMVPQKKSQVVDPCVGAAVTEENNRSRPFLEPQCHEKRVYQMIHAADVAIGSFTSSGTSCTVTRVLQCFPNLKGRA